MPRLTIGDTIPPMSAEEFARLRPDWRWMTGSGQRTSLDDMSDEHILNTIAMLNRLHIEDLNSRMLRMEILRRQANTPVPPEAQTILIGQTTLTPKYMDFSGDAVLSLGSDDLFLVIQQFGKPSLTQIDTHELFVLAAPCGDSALVGVTRDLFHSTPQEYTTAIDLAKTLRSLARPYHYSVDVDMPRLTLPLGLFTQRHDEDRLTTNIKRLFPPDILAPTFPEPIEDESCDESDEEEEDEDDVIHVPDEERDDIDAPHHILRSSRLWATTNVWSDNGGTATLSTNPSNLPDAPF